MQRVLALAIFVGAFALPLAGALISGERPLDFYFQFPPEVLREFPAFDPVVTGMVVLPSAIYLGTILLPGRFGFRAREVAAVAPAAPFPRWGWAGLLLSAVAWAVAWLPTWLPLAPLDPVRQHTFTPLWVGYILVMDGLVFRKKGSSLVSRSLPGFLILFSASAVLWWIFEYVNRFVRNWYYLGVDHYSTVEYVLFATPAFATVLPALLETAEWIGAQRFVERWFADGPKLNNPGCIAGITGVVGAVGFACMGIWPNYFFPFAWLGPLFVLVPLIHRYSPDASILTELSRGDHRAFVALTLCGPVCGFFWEMWNYYSLPKWGYQVPYVSFGHIFEMPVLGYFGYVPFGWECLVMWQAWRMVWGIRDDRITVTTAARAP